MQYNLRNSWIKRSVHIHHSCNFPKVFLTMVSEICEYETHDPRKWQPGNWPLSHLGNLFFISFIYFMSVSLLHHISVFTSFQSFLFISFPRCLFHIPLQESSELLLQILLTYLFANPLGIRGTCVWIINCSLTFPQMKESLFNVSPISSPVTKMQCHA